MAAAGAASASAAPPTDCEGVLGPPKAPARPPLSPPKKEVEGVANFCADDGSLSIETSSSPPRTPSTSSSSSSSGNGVASALADSKEVAARGPPSVSPLNPPPSSPAACVAGAAEDADDLGGVVSLPGGIVRLPGLYQRLALECRVLHQRLAL